MTDDYQFPQVDRKSFKPIYVQVAEMILEYAQHLGLNPGDALPSENQLLAHLDVSRNSIRQAVDRLVQMDFAIKRRGQGTFIKSWKRDIRLDFTQGFEGSLYKRGIQADNELVALTDNPGRLLWAQALTPILDDPITFIRRVKKVDGKPIALEDRLLPSYIIKRYTHTELAQENLNPNLLQRFPDTQVETFRYHFEASPLTSDEAPCLGCQPGTVLLQRLGEYFNPAGDRIMLGRHIFASNTYNVSYEFAYKDGHWGLT